MRDTTYNFKPHPLNPYTMASNKESHTLTGLLPKAAQSFPDKRALSAGKFETSHSPLQELIDQSASELRSARVSPRDVVVLSFPNSIQLVIVRKENSNGYPSAQAVPSKLGIPRVTVSLPDPTGLAHISVPTLNGDSTHGLVHDFSNDQSDEALLLHNSGTMSRPKVIALTTQHNLSTLVQSIASEYRITHSDSTVGVLPMFYVHGLLARLLTALSAGGSVTLASLGQFSASTFWGDMHMPGSVDKPVGHELAVLDDKGVPQLTGVAGEVCIRWPNVTKGYKKNPEANEAAFLFGWFHTGHLNEDGYLHLVGRVMELTNNGGNFQVDRITVDVGVPISVPAVDISPPEASKHNTGRGPINVELELPKVDLEVGLGNQTSPSESREQNTFNIEVNSHPALSVPNGSNGIWHLWYITGCNFVSNATIGVLYLGNKLQGCNETYQRAELIASVGAPIAVAAGTFVASFLFASNPRRWSNWISGMSRINAGMTIGGPLSFNWVRNCGIEN